MRFQLSILSGLKNVRPALVVPKAPFFSTLQWASYSSASNSSPNYKLENRNTGKHILSRKTFLVDYYKYLNDTNEILLYVHHNNLNKTENKKFRSELNKAGARLNIIRNSIYNVYLRSEYEEDPADLETSKKNKDVKHPLSPLLNGPTGIISIPKCEPAVVAQVLKVLKGANEKLILIGAKIETSIYDSADIDKFKDLPGKAELQGQLAGLLTVLGGAGLVRTLEASGNVLYLTLEERRKDIDPNEKSKDEEESSKQ